MNCRDLDTKGKGKEASKSSSKQIHVRVTPTVAAAPKVLLSHCVVGAGSELLVPHPTVKLVVPATAAATTITARPLPLHAATGPATISTSL